MPFVCDLLEDPDVARVAGPTAPQSLADVVPGAFVGFIRDGDPGWPSYDGSRSVMVFDADPAVTDGGYESARALTAVDDEG